MLYTIQKGDTLSRLAKRFKTSVGELAKRNKITNVNKIYTGAALDVPEQAALGQAAQAAEIKPFAAEAQTAKSWSAPETGLYAQSEAKAASAPYKSAYADEIEALIKKLDEREDFKYELSEDPVYDNYRDSYTKNGQLAMRDSMGEAAALTGGYGSSYAQSVGQQTYQAYMSALSDKVPELAQNAYDRYMSEEDALRKKLDSYGQLDATAYSRYRDEAEYELERERLAYERYRDERDEALERYKLEREEQEDDREWQYRLEQDAAKTQTKSASKGSSSGKSTGSKTGESDKGSEAEDIYELFESMTERERKAIFSDLPSVEYMLGVLGEKGYAAIKRKYGVS